MQVIALEEAELVEGGNFKDGLTAVGAGAAAGARVGSYAGPQAGAIGCLIGAVVGLFLYLI